MQGRYGDTDHGDGMGQTAWGQDGDGSHVDGDRLTEMGAAL